ncbi:MAG: 2-oxo acid dehydrogenase subunit E2 [Pararhodobacter sp.]|nr:2-oxo acid dehydrogenase subunit E2 [Pararhodobacter sp.]
MLRRDRPDGTRLHDLPRLRRIMPFIMPSRTEALIHFEQRLELRATMAWLVRWNEGTGPGSGPESDPDSGPARPPLTLFHVLMAALVRTLHERPRMNRFVAGRRLWQRNEIAISLSVIKAHNDDDARLSVVKQHFDPAEGLIATRARIETATANGRAAKKTASEREVALVTRLPAPVIGALVRLQRLADRWNLLPGALIRNDPLYASAMVSNLGSIGLDACWHHLYEHGTLSVFLTIGRLGPQPFARPDGTLAVSPGVTLRYAWDDRVADGHYAARSLALFQALAEQPWLLERPEDGGPGAPADAVQGQATGQGA